MSRFLLRPVRHDEGLLIYTWRNAPKTRAAMADTRPIDRKAHERWWPGALVAPDRRMLMLEDCGTPLAVAVFLQVQPGLSARWGFYTRPGPVPGRALLALERAALSYAFRHLSLERLDCEIRTGKRSVLRMHALAGFSVPGAGATTTAATPGFVPRCFTAADFARGGGFTRFPQAAIQLDPRDRAVPVRAKDHGWRRQVNRSAVIRED